MAVAGAAAVSLVAYALWAGVGQGGCLAVLHPPCHQRASHRKVKVQSYGSRQVKVQRRVRTSDLEGAFPTWCSG